MDRLLPPAVDDYLDELVTAEVYDPIVVELERRASELDRPIPGRAIGRHLELLLGMIGARRAIELRAGFGALSYWLARGVGPEGRLTTVTDDPDDARVAADVLRRAGTFARVTPVVRGSGPTAGPPPSLPTLIQAPMDAIVGPVELDGVEVAATWRALADHVEVGGVLVVLGVLRGGHLATPGVTDLGDDRVKEPVIDDATVATITREVVNDPRFVTTITPLRDGVLIARRIPDEAITLY